MRAGAVAAGTVFCLTVSGVAQAPVELTFCVGAESPTTSRVGISPEVEVDVARALAAELGASTLFVRLDPHDTEPEQAVLAGRCQAALGVIDDPSLVTGDRSPAGISLTDPYYAAGYALISRADVRRVRTLAELGESRIGVEKESVVAFTLRQRGHRVHVLPNSGAVIRAVAERRLDYGYLWGPMAAVLLRTGTYVSAVRSFKTSDRWDFAMAVRERDDDLRRRLNTAIHTLVKTGAVAQILTEHGIPFMNPRSNVPSLSRSTPAPDTIKP